MFRVRTVFTGVAGAPWLNTLYFDEIGTASAALANAKAGAFWGAVDALMGNQVSWSTEAVVATVNSANGQITGLTAVTPVTGTGALAGELVPSAAQALVQLRTGVFINGREIRGRIFIPGLTSTSVNDGDLDSAERAAILSAAQTLIDGVDADICVYSRRNSTYAIPTGVDVWGEFAVLRSRRD